MTFLCRLTDDELAAREVTARAAAHDAPMKAFRLDHDGHKWVEGTDAFARRAEEWCEIKSEIERRARWTRAEEGGRHHG
jgi:hypothetical protein